MSEDVSALEGIEISREWCSKIFFVILWSFLNLSSASGISMENLISYADKNLTSQIVSIANWREISWRDVCQLSQNSSQKRLSEVLFMNETIEWKKNSKKENV